MLYPVYLAMNGARTDNTTLVVIALIAQVVINHGRVRAKTGLLAITVMCPSETNSLCKIILILTYALEQNKRNGENKRINLNSINRDLFVMSFRNNTYTSIAYIHNPLLKIQNKRSSITQYLKQNNKSININLHVIFVFLTPCLFSMYIS